MAKAAVIASANPKTNIAIFLFIAIKRNVMGPYLNIDDQSYFCHFGLVAKSWLAGNDKISGFNPSESDKKTNDCEQFI